MLATILRRLRNPRTARLCRRCPQRSPRLVVEALEARDVPSVDQVFDPVAMGGSNLSTSVAWFNLTSEAAQTFTVGMTGVLTEVDLYMFRFSGDTGPLILDIRGVEPDGKPTAGADQVLLTTSVAASAVPGSPPAFYAFDLSSFNFHVTQGDKLAVVIHVGADPNCNVTYWWGGRTEDPYPGGVMAVRDNGTPGWLIQDTGWDLGFRTWVDQAANQAPVVTLPGGTVDYTENSAPAGLDSGATVTDSDSSNFETGTLTVSLTANGTADDRLEIRNQGSGAGQIGVSGTTVTYGGTAIGTFSGGAGATPLTVTLNANATPTATQALVQNLTFRTLTDNPSIASRTVQIVLTDGDGGTSSPVTKTVTVTASNDAPVVSTNTGLTVNEGATGAIAASKLAATDPDDGPAQLTFNVTVATAHGTLLRNNVPSTSFTQADIDAGLMSYQHDGGETTSDSFTFTVSDGTASTPATVFNITVTPVNDPPDAHDDSFGISEDSGATALPVLTNDTTVETAETLTIVAITQGTHGSVTITGGGTGLTYQPAAGYTGPDSFTYTISDGNGGQDTATVSVNVVANNPPSAKNDEATVVEDGGAQAIGVLTNDSDPDAGDTLTITSVTQGTHGTVAITGNGTGLTYEPAADYTGPDLFTYTVSDGNGGTATAQVVASVEPALNNPPDAKDDSATLAEDGGAQTIDVLANDSTAPDSGETLSIVTASQGEHGTVAIAADGKSVTYTPATNFAGSDSFLYAVSDGNGATDFASVTVNVANDVADRLEVVASPGTLVFTEGDAPVPVDANVRLSANNSGLKKAVVKIATGYVRGRDVLFLPATPGLRASFSAKTGTLTINGVATTAAYEAALRTVMYKNASPAPVAGVRTATFAVTDTFGTGDPASRKVQVVEINTPPVITLDSAVLTYKGNAPALSIARSIKIADLDNTRLTGATVAITEGFVSGQDLLTFTPRTGITGNYNAATGVLTLTGNATLATYRSVLRSVKYKNTSAIPTTGSRTLTITASDATSTSLPATRTVNVAPAPLFRTSA